MTDLFRSANVADGLSAPHNHFGLLRLLLALAVVVSHAVSVTTGHVTDEPLVASTGFSLGEHAVNGFFGISGFLVTMSFAQRGWRDYVVARALRIAPGLIAATLVVSLLLGSAFTRMDLGAYLADTELWRFIWRTLTTFKSSAPLPGVFQDNPLQFPMGTVWTLKYETICYGGVLALGLAGLLLNRRLALLVWALLVVATIAREVVDPEGPKSVETMLRLPLIFYTGGLIYLWRERLPLSLAGLAVAMVLTALLSATPVYKAALYVVTAWGVLVLAMAPVLTGWRSEPPADLSYGVYLYGWPIQQSFVALFPTAAALTLFLPSLAVTVLVAAASWYWVEKPALGLKRRLMGRR